MINWTVVGVVEDARLASAKEPVKPLVFHWTPEAYDYVNIRITAGAVADTARRVETAWNRFLPQVPFHSSFLEDTYNTLYAAEDRQGEVLTAHIPAELDRVGRAA